ncbi:hypothetical protein KGQ55_02845 [Patescibacteria group bacterium]|nr:hypothetical protein [Patescibacteria group bacterium]
MLASRTARLIAAPVIALSAGALGYGLSAASTDGANANPANVRVIYSLDKKQDDKEIIALIDGARKYAYFAMYEFTLKDIADALVAAKERGIDVRGLVDAGESGNSYDAPIIAQLRAAGIPVFTEHHADGSGIMHIKAIVTDQAYASGSYNWTGSATNENDEVLEIGTDPALRARYEEIVKGLIDKYGAAQGALPAGTSFTPAGTYDYMQAPAHVGEYASVTGTVHDVYRSAGGTIFLDYCASYKTCPFAGVIFATDASKFPALDSYGGKKLTLTGTISSYQGRAEIVLSSPSQIGLQ